MLQQSRSKVLQYNAYEATYGFPISEYYDLVAAEKNLIALKTVWKSTEEWESMYTRWAGTEFSQLHVEELKVIEIILFDYESYFFKYVSLLCKLHTFTKIIIYRFSTELR